MSLSNDRVAQTVTTGLVKLGIALKSRDWREAGEQGLHLPKGRFSRSCGFGKHVECG